MYSIDKKVLIFILFIYFLMILTLDEWNFVCWNDDKFMLICQVQRCILPELIGGGTYFSFMQN